VNHDAAEMYRRIPKGIFPLPNNKRVVMEPADTLKQLPSGTDKFIRYEKDPL